MQVSTPHELPIREWLELGQALTDRCNVGPKYFRAHHTQMIRIAMPDGLWADGKLYSVGDYVLRRLS